MSGSEIIAILLGGFITGGLARFAVPGPDPMPIWLTLSIGLVGSIVGAVVGDAISNGNGFVISFLSYGVAVALVIAYRRFVQHRPVYGAGAYAYPETGVGVGKQRERLRRLGIDPSALRSAARRPDPQRLRHAQLEAMLEELHRAGLLDDDELAAKRAALEREQ